MNAFLTVGRRRLAAIAAIARAESIGINRQPVMYVIAAAAAAMIFFSKDFTMFTFDWGSGDDPSYIRTMIREMGLATILLSGLFIALLAASRSIYDEIVNKTALATLSKPVSRTDFILGKYTGIVLGVLPLFLFLGVILFLGIWSQSAADVTAGVDKATVWDGSIWKGIYLMYLKAAVLIALAVAVSTRLPFIPNILIVLSAFVICHLLNYFNGYLRQVQGIMFYVLQFVYAVFLNLENYNYFFHGDPHLVPSGMLILLVTVYTAVYTAILLIIADVSFARRDLY